MKCVILPNLTYLIGFNLETDEVTLLQSQVAESNLHFIHIENQMELEAVFRRAIYQFGFIYRHPVEVGSLALNEGVPQIELKEANVWVNEKGEVEKIEHLLPYIYKQNRPVGLAYCLEEAIHNAGEEIHVEGKFELKELNVEDLSYTHRVFCETVSADHIGRLELFAEGKKWKDSHEGVSLNDYLAEFANCILGLVNRDLQDAGVESRMSLPVVNPNGEQFKSNTGPFFNPFILGDLKRGILVSLGFVNLRRVNKIVFPEIKNPPLKEIEFL